MAYDLYLDWKSWDPSRFMALSDYESAYYEGELRGLDLAGRQVLEVGFGSGSFLEFCRRRGGHVCGTELIPALRERAEAAGVEVLSSTPSVIAEKFPARFDLVAAFDVFEHLTFDELVRFFESATKLLRPGGVLVARFPNGQSPLGRVFQHGDHTHRTVLSASIVRQLLVGSAFEIVHAGNPFHPRTGPLPKRIASGLRWASQRAAESAIRAVYGLNVPLHPNTVIYLRKAQ